MRRLRGCGAALGAVIVACGPAAVPDPQSEIAAMLSRSAAAWNAGDLAGFMDDYARDSLLSYVSGSRVLYGWQTLYDRYQRAFFDEGKTHDSLAFDSLRVRALAPDVALATARFALLRADSVVASGPFTLILRKTDDGWRILHDHTSSDPK
jgi:beta-aspartyl-peptidase (threonine type)